MSWEKRKDIDQEYFLKNGQILREQLSVVSELGFRSGEKQFYLQIEDSLGFSGDCMTPETAKRLASELNKMATKCIQKREQINGPRKNNRD